MVKNLPKPSKYELLRTRLGVRIESVIDVVNPTEFALALQTGGYKMLQDANVGLTFHGEKGSSEIYIDGPKKVFGANAESIDSVVTTVKEMFSLVNKSRDLVLEEHVAFYEFEIVAIYHYGKDVYVPMSKLFQDSVDMVKLRKIAGLTNMSQFSIKLTPSTQNINNPEWHELTIEPQIHSAGNLLYIRMIARSKELTKVTSIARRTEETAKEIIETVITR